MHDRTSLDEIKALARRLEREYAEDPNVVGVGWGMAQRGGEVKPELSLVFYVREKLSGDELEEAGTRPVPEEIEGFATDVVVRGPVEQQQLAGSRDDDLYDPLRGGVSSSNLEQRERTFFWSYGGRGTLGILCKDSGNRPMALSNWHVWADEGAENGDRIVQPSTPEAGGYAEGIAKTILCGPILGSLLEGRIPSGLAAGLYGGAAAAAGLAALTDERDPFRRGQDATPEAGGAVTHEETLEVALDYGDTLPWPGTPFSTDVDWQYERSTNQGAMVADAAEVQENPQVLHGYAVAPERSVYERGEEITVRAALWDYQPRPADAYHVVAHLVSEKDPSREIRLLLRPAPCTGVRLVPKARKLDAVTETGEGVCVSFGHFPPDHVFAPAHNFGPVAVAYWTGDPLRMAGSFPDAGSGLSVPDSGVVLRHPPASAIELRLGHRTQEPVRVQAYNAFDRIVAEAEVPAETETVHHVELEGRMITHVRILGGEGRVELFRYCFQPVTRGDHAAAARDPSRLGTPVVDSLACLDFASRPVGATFPSPHEFAGVTVRTGGGENLRIVGWPGDEPNSLYFSREGLVLEHEATDRVLLRIGHFTGEDVRIRGLDEDGAEVAEVIKTSANQTETLELRGEGIVSVEITGGGHEGVLVQYCRDVGDDPGTSRSLMRCFEGRRTLPDDAPSGRWIVYLAVQNVNHAGGGLPPEEAATVIGGHGMAPVAAVLGCGFMLLGDHVFDIF